MAGVYMGDSGHVELRRTSENVPIRGTLQPEDVNPPRRRFSLNFDPSALISGDRISIRRLDGKTLELVSGPSFPDGTWYCHIDDAGGIRLYDTFADALNGEKSDALQLIHPNGSQDIEILLANRQYRCVAGITEWSLTTNRDAADLTGLGDEHRRFYSNGLMSGQGRMQCLWNYEQNVCAADGGNVELPHYIAQLVLRCQLGAEFLGQFYIKNRGAAPAHGQLSRGSENDLIWWDAECIITNVGMTFNPGQPIATTIEFITTGPIRLKMGTPLGYLLQESGDYLLQENRDRILLEEED